MIMEGRPSKANEQEHVVMQMRKNITMNGSKPIKFADGQEHPISSSHAQKVLAAYDSYKKPNEKQQFQKHIGSSHREFTDWIGGKKFVPGNESSSKPEARGINNDEIFGSKQLRESSIVRTITSLKHRQQIAEQREQRQKFRRRLADIIASV